MQTKRCPRCKEIKAADQFWQKRSAKDGLYSHCKTCANASTHAALTRGGPRVAIDGMKECRECRVKKPVSSFPRHKRHFDGLNPLCKSCSYARHKAWAATPQAKAKLREKKRAEYQRNRDQQLDQRLRKRYGLDADWTYAAMMERHRGVCDICGAKTSHGNLRLAIDHNAKTGAVRGLLCTCCNQAIGQLRDSPALLRRAADYLENPPGP